jgi:hypothetical protein
LRVDEVLIDIQLQEIDIAPIELRRVPHRQVHTVDRNVAVEVCRESHLAEVDVRTRPPDPGRVILRRADCDGQRVALLQLQVDQGEAAFLPPVADRAGGVERGADGHDGIGVHPHAAIAGVAGPDGLVLLVDVVGDGAVEELPLQSEIMAAVRGEREKIVAALLVIHAPVLQVVDAAIVVRGDELLRRTRESGNVAAAVLIRVLAVANHGDVP